MNKEKTIVRISGHSYLACIEFALTAMSKIVSDSRFDSVGHFARVSVENHDRIKTFIEKHAKGGKYSRILSAMVDYVLGAEGLKKRAFERLLETDGTRLNTTLALNTLLDVFFEEDEASRVEWSVFFKVLMSKGGSC